MLDDTLDQQPQQPAKTPAPSDWTQKESVSLPEWEDIVRQKYNIAPDVWKALSTSESGGNWNAQSPTGVKGKYQVTESTAKGYGLDRNDPYQQVVAAAKTWNDAYGSIKHLYQTDDERNLAARAIYFNGPNAIDKKTGNFNENGGNITSVVNDATKFAKNVAKARDWNDLQSGIDWGQVNNPTPPPAQVAQSPAPAQPAPAPTGTLYSKPAGPELTAPIAPPTRQQQQAVENWRPTPQGPTREELKQVRSGAVQAQDQAYYKARPVRRAVANLATGAAEGGKGTSQFLANVLNAAGGANIPGLPGADVLAAAGRGIQSLTDEQAAKIQDAVGSLPQETRDALLQGAASGLAALPRYAIADLAAGPLGGAAMGYAEQDWRDPKKAAIQGTANAVMATGGHLANKLAGRGAQALANRLAASGVSDTAAAPAATLANVVGRTVGGGALGGGTAVASDLAQGNRVDLKNAAVGTVLGAGMSNLSNPRIRPEVAAPASFVPAVNDAVMVDVKGTPVEGTLVGQTADGRARVKTAQGFTILTTADRLSAPPMAAPPPVVEQPASQVATPEGGNLTPEEIAGLPGNLGNIFKTFDASQQAAKGETSVPSQATQPAPKQVATVARPEEVPVAARPAEPVVQPVPGSDVQVAPTPAIPTEHPLTSAVKAGDTNAVQSALGKVKGKRLTTDAEGNVTVHPDIVAAAEAAGGKAIGVQWKNPNSKHGIAAGVQILDANGNVIHGPSNEAVANAANILSKRKTAPTANAPEVRAETRPETRVPAETPAPVASVSAPVEGTPHEVRVARVREIYGNNVDEATANQIALREANRSAAEKGILGKLGQIARKSLLRDDGTEIPSLAENNTLRRSLGLPDMPDYSDKKAWGDAAQHTMDALAERVGAARSSRMGETELNAAQRVIAEAPHDPDLHESWSRTLAGTEAVSKRIDLVVDHPEVAAVLKANADKPITEWTQDQHAALYQAVLKASAEANALKEGPLAPVMERGRLIKGTETRRPTDIGLVTDTALKTFAKDLRNGTADEWLSRNIESRRAARTAEGNVGEVKHGSVSERPQESAQPLARAGGEGGGESAKPAERPRGAGRRKGADVQSEAPAAPETAVKAPTESKPSVSAAKGSERGTGAERSTPSKEELAVRDKQTELDDLKSELKDVREQLDATKGLGRKGQELLAQEDYLMEEQSRVQKELRELQSKAGKKSGTMLDQMAEDAKARIEKNIKGGKLGAGLDPQDIIDHAIVAARDIRNGVQNFREWAKGMIQEFGEKVRPALQKIWTKAQDFAKEELGAAGAPKDVQIERERLKAAKATSRDAFFKELSRNLNEKIPLPAGFDVRADVIRPLVDYTKKSPHLTPKRLANIEQISTDIMTAIANSDGEALARSRRLLDTELTNRKWIVGDFWRSLQAVGELSVIARQGYLGWITHPLLSIEATRRIGSGESAGRFIKNSYDRAIAIIEANPKYREARKVGVDFQTSKEHSLGREVLNREENFATGLVQKIPILKHFEQINKSFIENQRLLIYEHLSEGLRARGEKPILDNGSVNPQYAAIAKQINRMTGRGNIKEALRSAVNTASFAFFSPRFAISRFQAIDLSSGFREWKKGNITAAKEIARTQIAILASASALGGLAKLLGAEINLTDPNNPDWLVAKFGTYRIPLLQGGIGPAARFVGKMVFNAADYLRSQANGDDKGATDAEEKAFNDIGSFLRKKQSPMVSLIWDQSPLPGGAKWRWDAQQGKNVYIGKNAIGEYKTKWDDIKDHFGPIYWHQALETVQYGYNQSGVKGAAIGAASQVPEFVGLGTNRYDNNLPRFGNEEAKGFIKRGWTISTEGRPKFSEKPFSFIGDKLMNSDVKQEPLPRLQQRQQAAQALFDQHYSELVNSGEYQQASKSEQRAMVDSLKKRIAEHEDTGAHKESSFSTDSIIRGRRQSQRMQERRAQRVEGWR